MKRAFNMVALFALLGACGAGGGPTAGPTGAVLAPSVPGTVAAPADIPLGVLTALLGAPFFLALLWKNRGALGG